MEPVENSHLFKLVGRSVETFINLDVFRNRSLKKSQIHREGRYWSAVVSSRHTDFTIKEKFEHVMVPAALKDSEKGNHGEIEKLPYKDF